jgi:hypothetical protein
MSTTQETPSETPSFETPETLIESLLDYVNKLNVVFIDIFTNAGGTRRGWTFNRFPAYQLGDRKYMKEMLEDVNNFREEWPKGHSTVIYDGIHVTITLT